MRFAVAEAWLGIRCTAAGLIEGSTNSDDRPWRSTASRRRVAMLHRVEQE